MNLAALRQQRRERAAVFEAAKASTERLAASIARLEALYAAHPELQGRSAGLTWSGPGPTTLRAVDSGIRSVTAGDVLGVR